MQTTSEPAARVLKTSTNQEVFFNVFNTLPSFDGSVSLLIFVFHITPLVGLLLAAGALATRRLVGRAVAPS